MHIHVRDWPGLAGPLVHLADPMREASAATRLAEALAPRYRVLSILARPEQPYQVHVVDLLGVLAQFGFERPLLAPEGASCISALLLAAWYPERVGALALIDAQPQSGDGIRARSLRDCPPDWQSIRAAVQCPIVELAGGSPELLGEVERLMGGPLP